VDDYRLGDIERCLGQFDEPSFDDITTFPVN